MFEFVSSIRLAVNPFSTRREKYVITELYMLLLYLSRQIKAQSSMITKWLEVLNTDPRVSGLSLWHDLTFIQSEESGKLSVNQNIGTTRCCHIKRNDLGHSHYPKNYIGGLGK